MNEKKLNELLKCEIIKKVHKSIYCKWKFLIKIANVFECFNKFVELDKTFFYENAHITKNLLTYVLHTKSNIKD